MVWCMGWFANAFAWGRHYLRLGFAFALAFASSSGSASALLARLTLCAGPALFGDREQLTVMMNTFAAAVASYAGAASMLRSVFEYHFAQRSR